MLGLFDRPAAPDYLGALGGWAQIRKTRKKPCQTQRGELSTQYPLSAGILTCDGETRDDETGATSREWHFGNTFSEETGHFSAFYDNRFAFPWNRSWIRPSTAFFLDPDRRWRGR